MLSSDRLLEHKGENSSLLLESLLGVIHSVLGSVIILLTYIKEGLVYHLTYAILLTSSYTQIDKRVVE